MWWVHEPILQQNQERVDPMNKSPTDIMKSKGISPSITRTKIFSFFDDTNHHPTVDEIYQGLVQELPTLSKTTVYNTLKLFCEHNLVKPVTINSSESRYEMYHEPHSHFQCNSCGEITDIPYIKPTYSIKELDGYIVTEDEVHLTGICPSCQ